MIFLGTTFFSGRHTLDEPATNILPIEKLKIRDGTFDQIYMSKNADTTIDMTHNEWDEDTLLNAPFDDSVDAGNCGFSLRNTDTVVIKVREKGTFDWKVIYTKDIETIEDFDIYELYKYARGGDTDYEIMMASTCNGVENSTVVSEVTSSFEGFFVMDKENTVGTLFDIGDNNTVRNTLGEPLELLSEKYPTYISNASANYTTGTTSGTFLALTEYDSVDKAGGVRLRKNAIDVLSDNKAHILKLSDGRIWLIKITGQIQNNRVEHDDQRQISFDWVEIGDVNNQETLYNLGLSDVPREWWY